MIALDFFPGSHGYFLEYVINRWIYRVPFEMDDPFQSSGSSHRISQDKTYQNSKQVTAMHFSVFGKNYPINTNKVIRIKHCSKLDYVVLTNVFYRTHPVASNSIDYPTEQIQKFHYDNISVVGMVTDQKLRNDWYDKLFNGNIFGANSYTTPKLPYFDFDIQAFFNFSNFLSELQQVANFLDYTFSYDIKLWYVWEKFMALNQGWNAYKHADTILNSIYSNQAMDIDRDWKLHAWINTQMSKNFKIYDGVLFENLEYPTNTQEIYQITKIYLDNFDQRF